MTNTNTITFTATDKTVLRTAAYGAVTLIGYADVAGSPHKAITHGTLALASATGPVGHVLAAKSKDFKLNAKSAAALADQVLPALTASVAFLKDRSQAEAENFRSTVTVAVRAAGLGEPSPAVAEMIRKIDAALDAV